MAETGNVADAPRKAAKGLGGIFKGKPAWIWVAGVTILLGVAYITLRKGQATTAEDDAVDTQTDDGTSYDYGEVPTYTTTGSEGAYGGYDQPQDYTTPTGTETPAAQPVTVNVTYPAPTGGGKPAATGTAVHAPVAGGARKWDGHPLSWWQSPTHARKKVKVGNKMVYRWRWPGGGGYKHTRAFAGHG